MKTLKVVTLANLTFLFNISFAIASLEKSFLVTGDMLTVDEIRNLCDQRENKVSQNADEPLSKRICLMNFENAKQYCSDHGGLPTASELAELAVKHGSKRISSADKVNTMGWKRSDHVRSEKLNEVQYFINFSNSLMHTSEEGGLFLDPNWTPFIWTETVIKYADGKTYLDDTEDQRLPHDFEFARQRISLSMNNDVFVFSMKDGGEIYGHGVHPTAFTEAVRCRGSL